MNYKIFNQLIKRKFINFQRSFKINLIKQQLNGNYHKNKNKLNNKVLLIKILLNIKKKYKSLIMKKFIMNNFFKNKIKKYCYMKKN